MVNISISGEILAFVPQVSLSCIECDVSVMPSSSGLADLIDAKAGELASSLKVEDISRLPTIRASRQAYKSCGKDPARYRLSAEALLRRIVKGVGLYRINNVVDLLNLVSFSTGFSIGGYDAGKIGGSVVFGIGRADEIYEGVGKGMLNIEGLPVFRDPAGAFGSPTSDSERTSVTGLTKRFLMVIIGFGDASGLEEASRFAVKLLETHAAATNIETHLITTTC